MNNTFKMLSVLIALFNYSFCTINAHNNEDITVNDIYAFRDGEETDDDETTFHGIDAIYNALESINDNSYNNRYIIHIDGHFIFNDVSHHVKLMRSKDNYNTWFVNVYGKDYVTLDGGNKDNTSVEMYLDLNTEFPYWSDGIHRYYGGNYHVIFNNARWFECRNITFIGRNTRYALHQEDFNKYEPSYALFENCDFIFNYDRIWTKENVNIPEDQTIMGGNTVLGCGYRNGGDITFRNCLIKGGVGANTLLIGSHTGFFISENFNYIPADIKFDNCIMEGGDRLLGYSSMGWQVQDVFHFNDCLFNTDAYISLNVSSYILNDNPLSCSLAVFKDNSPMPVARHKSDGSNVLKISALNVETSRIRLVKECTAQEIFADRNNHSNNKTMMEWGAYKSDNTIYKDDDFGCDGYLLGTNSINKNTLGKRLGDCSINNKTFSFTINDTLYSFTFKEDMTNLTNSEVINMLNEAFDGKAVFSVIPLSSYFFPKFDNV